MIKQLLNPVNYSFYFKKKLHSSSFVIRNSRNNLLHSCPFMVNYYLQEMIFSCYLFDIFPATFVNYYSQVSFNLKLILYAAYLTQNSSGNNVSFVRYCIATNQTLVFGNLSHYCNFHLLLKCSQPLLVSIWCNVSIH